MSKVVIQGNASGTGDFTIAAPNSNTDRTLTLPDEAGEVLVTNGTSLVVDNTNDRVGIGNNSPTSRLEVTHDVDISMNASGTGHFEIDGNGYNFAIALDASGANLYTNSASRDLIFGTNETERMRIDGSGRVLIGTTTPAHSLGKTGIVFNGAAEVAMALKTTYGATGSSFIYFVNSTGAIQGFISASGTTGTAYNTSSDYRLKEDWQPMSGSVDRVKALKPVNFAWKADGSRVDGFLAHEAQAIVPEAVTGIKDGMRDQEYEVTAAIEATYDEEGNELTAAVPAVMGTRTVPDYQGIDQSKLVPLLTAALQEAITKIETLEARVTALENA